MSLFKQGYGVDPVMYRLRLAGIDKQAAEVSAELAETKLLLAEVNKKHNELKERLEGFYGKLIEIFGLFIAIFSFIIAGIQTAAKVEGGFLEKLGSSAAVFVPVTFCIIALLLTIRWTSRR
jgi:hypothetical protein